MFPSTRGTASVAGFVAGGSGGVGSITWGGLRDFGNVLRLRVMTLEAEPRTLELTGEDLHKAVHAYGTNGIITEVEMPLTAHYDWVDVIVGFDSFDAAAAYALALGEQDGILKKLVTVVAGPTPHDYFLRHRALIPARRQRRHPDDRPACARRVRSLHPALQGRAYPARLEPRGARDARRPAAQLRTDLEPHHAARVAGRSPHHLPAGPLSRARARSTLIKRIHDRYGDEVRGHLEVIRFNGRIGFAGLPLVRFSTEERLNEIIAEHEAMGAMIFNPHRYTLEEGGMKQTDAIQLAFKRETDPAGLLNPGKMIAWENPDFDFLRRQELPLSRPRGAGARGAELSGVAHPGPVRPSGRDEFRRGRCTRKSSRSCARRDTRSTIAISTRKASIR